MYNQTYDDYMRSVLGYPNSDGYRMDNMGMNSMRNMGMNNMNTMGNMGMNNMNGMCNMTMNMNEQDEDIERLYPEVYRVVYPMVCCSCDRIQFPNTPVTDEMVTRMTDDIYDQVETDPRINIEVNVTTEVRDSSKSSDSAVETRQRPRPRPRNRFLRDLIRILFLRELFRRRRFPGRFPGRPGFPMRPF